MGIAEATIDAPLGATGHGKVFQKKIPSAVYLRGCRLLMPGEAWVVSRMRLWFSRASSAQVTTDFDLVWEGGRVKQKVSEPVTDTVENAAFPVLREVRTGDSRPIVSKASNSDVENGDLVALHIQVQKLQAEIEDPFARRAGNKTVGMDVFSKFCTDKKNATGLELKVSKVENLLAESRSDLEWIIATSQVAEDAVTDKLVFGKCVVELTREVESMETADAQVYQSRDDWVGKLKGKVSHSHKMLDGAEYERDGATVHLH